jgi:cyclic pyranopterin phosphate synthase
LRISVTDRCNLRCSYCTPEGGADSAPYRLLSCGEIVEVVRAAVSLGVIHVRLTGGEPLVRPDLLDIVRGVSSLGVPDISLTTNGVLLKSSAAALREAGLGRVNVSLDSLDPAVFEKITRVGKVSDVLSGIQAAISAGLSPVKINAVVMAGVNEDGVTDLARLSLSLPVDVRFIEVMPIGPDAEANSRAVVTMDRIKAAVATIGPLNPASEVAGAGPALTYRIGGAPGTVGFIAPMSHPFCESCNRLRLTPDGKLRPCLASDAEVDLVPALKSADPQESLVVAFRQALSIKPAGHELWRHPSDSRRMCQIGG